MAAQNPGRKADDPRPMHEEHDPRDNPQRRPEDAQDLRRAGQSAPTAADARSGATAYPPVEGPDAAAPAAAPHTVVGKETPPQSYDPDAVDRQEAEARTSGTQAAPQREQQAVRSELLEDPQARRGGLLRFALILAALVVVVALIFVLI